MSGRGIVEAETWRTQQIEAEERSSDPPNAAVGDWWVRIDIKPSIDTDNVNTLGALRIQGSGGVLQVPLVNSSDSPYLGEDVYIGPQFQFGTYANDGISGSSVGFVPVTDQGGAKGSPRAVSPTGVVYEAHDDVELSAIPDDLLNQWVVENFASPWPDEIGNADMSISGLQTTTVDGETLVSGGGTDSGTANADVLGNRETWGVAVPFHAASTDVSDFEAWAGLFGPSGNDGLRFRVASDNADLAWRAGDGSSIRVTGGTIADGSIHALVINKNGDSGTDFSIYIDDMTTDTASVVEDQGVSHENWSLDMNWGFWSVNDSGTITDNIDADLGSPEFKSNPYSQQERQDWVNRTPSLG